MLKQFDLFLAGVETDEKHQGLLEIRPTLKLMIAADPARKAKDVALFETCTTLRDAALQVQAGTKEAVDAFVAKEGACPMLPVASHLRY